MEQLTNEQLARVYGAYISGKVLMDWNGKPTEFKVTYGIDKLFCFILPEGASFSQICKLLLTPLSAISDEDTIEVAKMLCQHGKVDFTQHKVGVIGRSDEKVLVKIGGLFLHIYFDGRMFATSEDKPPADYMPIYNTQKIIDYLRSNKRPEGTEKPVYDCGYGDIPSLIEAGIAIDKTA